MYINGFIHVCIIWWHSSNSARVSKETFFVKYRVGGHDGINDLPNRLTLSKTGLYFPHFYSILNDSSSFRNQRYEKKTHFQVSFFLSVLWSSCQCILHAFCMTLTHDRWRHWLHEAFKSRHKRLYTYMHTQFHTKSVWKSNKMKHAKIIESNKKWLVQNITSYKVGCVFLMVIWSEFRMEQYWDDHH